MVISALLLYILICSVYVDTETLNSSYDPLLIQPLGLVIRGRTSTPEAVLL